MTIWVADIASYQDGLRPEDVLGAGFTAVNVKTSHGLGRKSVSTRAREWLNDSRFTHSTFHWLTRDAPGRAQAEWAYQQLWAYGGERVGVLVSGGNVDLSLACELLSDVQSDV